MKIHDYFTSVNGEIIRLVEYEGKLERLYNGWPAFVETMTGARTERKGYGTISQAIENFNFERYKNDIRKQKQRLKDSQTMTSAYKDPLYFDICKLIVNSPASN